MTVLSDSTIRWLCQEHNLIQPFNEFPQLQPASYDLLLGELEGVGSGFTEYWLPSGHFILGSTVEMVSLHSNIVARMEGKSSLARRGLIVHTAGFVDPGFTGQLTLEITNLGGQPFKLEKDMKIAQIAFQYLDRPAERPYGHPELDSHYQNQRGITKARE